MRWADHAGCVSLQSESHWLRVLQVRTQWLRGESPDNRAVATRVATRSTHPLACNWPPATDDVEAIAGTVTPMVGSPPAGPDLDRRAQLGISNRLGHERIQILSAYAGKMSSHETKQQAPIGSGSSLRPSDHVVSEHRGLTVPLAQRGAAACHGSSPAFRYKRLDQPWAAPVRRVQPALAVNDVGSGRIHTQIQRGRAAGQPKHRGC